MFLKHFEFFYEHVENFGRNILFGKTSFGETPFDETPFDKTSFIEASFEVDGETSFGETSFGVDWQCNPFPGFTSGILNKH